MTGTLDLDDNGDGEVALIEENGEWSLYLRSDIEEKSDGSWGPKAGAMPSGTLNLKASNVKELSVTEGGSPAVTKEVFYRAEDSDSTTTLSVDTGQFPKVYDSVIVRGTIGGYGNGSYDIVKIGVNNSTSTGYGSYYRDGAALGSTGGVTYWLDETFNTTHMDVVWKLGTHDDIGDSGRGPSIRGMSSGHDGGRRLIDGYLNDGPEMPVDSVQVSTDWNAVCTLNFVGVSY